MNNFEFNTYQLDNGIRCLHKQINSSVVYCALTINAGSRDELANEYGLAHFVEHSMFKGTLERSSYDILSCIESRGGELNAYTSKEETVLNAVCLAEDAEDAVDIIADLAFNATFNKVKIDQEKKVIYDEINSYVDSYPEAIYDDFEDLLFKNSSLGHNILGTKKRLAKFDTQSLKGFVERCYTTDQMVFSLFGNFSFEQFKELCDKHFGGRAKSTRSYERTPTLAYNKFNKKQSKSDNQVHYMMGNRSFSLNDDRRLAASLTTNLLGGQSINSLLNVALREERGLTYNIEAAITPYIDTGIFSIYFTTDKKNLDQSLDVIKAQIKKVSDPDFVAKILPLAKKQFQGQFRISCENSESYMLNAARSYLIYNEVDNVDAVIKRIDAISTEQIIQVSECLFNDMSALSYQ